MEESFIGEVEYCKHVHWLPCGWRKWRPIKGKGIFGAVHRAALYAFIENGFQHQDLKEKMIKSIGRWVKKGSEYYPQHYNDMKFFYNILKQESLEEFVEAYEEQSEKLDRSIFLVAKIAIAEFVKKNKEWYSSDQQLLLRCTTELQNPDDFIKVHISNPEEAPIQGIEYYFKIFSMALMMNFHVSLASSKQLIISWPIYENEDKPTRDLVYFNEDETTMYLLQEIKPKATRSIPLLQNTVEVTNTSLKSLVDLLKSYKIKHSSEYRAQHQKEKKKYKIIDPRYREIHVLGNLGVRARDSASYSQQLFNDLSDNAYELREHRTFEHSHFSNALSFISSKEKQFQRFVANCLNLSKRYEAEQNEESKQAMHSLVTSVDHKGFLCTFASEFSSKCQKCKRKPPKTKIPICGHSLCQECMRNSVLSDSMKYYFTSEYSQTGALLLNCPIKGCLSLIDFRLVTNVFTGYKPINREFERYIKQYQEGKELQKPIVSKMCMNCKEKSRSLFGATDSHNQHRMCLRCWQQYVAYWEKNNIPLTCPFYECNENVKMHHGILTRIKGQPDKMSCSHCKRILTEGSDCCGGPICSGCIELNAKNQYFNGRNMVCPLCGKSLSQFIKVASEKKWPKEKKGKQILCEICFFEHNDEEEEMILLLCGHNFCKNSIQQQLSTQINQCDMRNLGCPKCQKPMPVSTIYSCLSQEDVQKLNIRKIERDYNIFHCSNKKCNFNAEIDQNTRKTMKYFKCLHCKTKTCLKCQDEWHPGQNCDSTKIIKNFKETKIVFSDQIVMACPYCLTAFMKDENCEHVTCGNGNCKKDFCFKGSCKRIPTMWHGNQYHRPDCEFYADYDDSKESAHPKCQECQRLGEKCPRPLPLEDGFIPKSEWPEIY